MSTTLFIDVLIQSLAALKDDMDSKQCRLIDKCYDANHVST